MKAVRCWLFFTVVVSIVNIVYALIVKVTVIVTWTYFAVQLVIGTGLFILVLVIDRHMEVSISNVKPILWGYINYTILFIQHNFCYDFYFSMHI